MPGQATNAISPIDGKLHWYKGQYIGEKDGQVMMILYPAAIVSDSNKKLSQAQLEACEPFFLGYVLGVTIHEYLHSLCGGHKDPDCPGIAIGIATAEELCKEVADLNACIAGACPPDSPYSGLSVEDLKKLKDGICSRIGELRDRHNGKKGSIMAQTCSGSSMKPGCLPTSYSDTMPQAPPGFTPPEEGQTGNWPIPACAACEVEEGPL